jgi:hypothetical protein
MIVVNLMGGLGNQMFEYAYGRALANRLGAELKLNHSILEANRQRRGTTQRKYELGAFGIDRRLTVLERLRVEWSARVSRIARIPGLYWLIKEDSPYSVDLAIPNYRKLVLSGYFQSQRYFADIHEVIRNDFTFVPPQPEYVEIINYIESIENSVAVLVRRADYVTQGNDFLLKRAYYDKAFRFMRGRLMNPRFLVFTIGDTSWSREIFQGDKQVEIIENDKPGLQNFEKMRLMSLCRHNIIANSSFGWWSAWLNRNPDKLVVAPQNWVNDRKLDRRIAESRIPFGWVQV